MKKALARRRPSPALFIATAALFLALGGTGYAAFKLAKNSVGTKQLKNGAVTTKKIKNGAVTAKKINTTGLTVPNATHASSADSATNASHASSADSATSASTLSTLPSGQSESGTYDAIGGTTSGGFIGAAISYPQPLAHAIPDANIIWGAPGANPHCPALGQADRGYLCLYDFTHNVATAFDAHSDESGFAGSTSPGAVFNWSATGNGAYAEGTWTVTAG